jgi:hypothetical protein
MEATGLGFPPYTWSVYDTIGDGSLSVLAPYVFQGDPGYFKDFWEVPGYLGADKNGSAVRDRVVFDTTVAGLIQPKEVTLNEGAGVDEAWLRLNGPEASGAVLLQEAPPSKAGAYRQKAFLTFTSGEGKGQRLTIRAIEGKTAILESGFGSESDKILLAKVKAGDSCTIDNSDLIAIQTYHRHQLPPAGEFPVWDALFRNDDGSPKYPQRQFVLGTMIAAGGGGGGTQSGVFEGKMIVIEALADEAAFPWCADWYRNRINKHFGAEADEHFRLYYIEHSMHGDVEATFDDTHFIPYLGTLHQALLSLSRWVEEGKAPPASTAYTVEQGQVLVAEAAAERCGLQPTVTLRSEVKGREASFSAEIASPPGSGAISGAWWDYEGKARHLAEKEYAAYLAPAELHYSTADKTAATVAGSYRYEKAGLYHPVLHVAACMESGDGARYTQMQNLARTELTIQ